MSVTARTGEALGSESSGSRRALVFYNARSGSAQANSLHVLETAFSTAGWRCVVHPIDWGDDLTAILGEARRLGVDLVVAAGGDGTIAAVGSCLVGTDVPLGIVPLGTGNIVAQELGIPLSLAASASLLVGEHDLRRIDAMRIGERCYFLQAGLGIDALTMRDTPAESKRRLGVLAYFLTFFDKLRAFDAVRFTIEVDGRLHHVRGWTALVANVGAVGGRALHWGVEVDPSDGLLDVVVIRVRRPLDYLPLLWRLVLHRGESGPALRVYPFRTAATISADRPLPVQADGDVVGESTLRVEVVPRAVSVVVPTLPETLAILGAGARHARYAAWFAAAAVADARAYLWVNQMPHPPALNALMRAASKLGSKGAIWAIGLIVAALLDPRRYLSLLRDTLPALALAGLTVEFPLKTFFRRPRPFDAIESAITTGRRPQHNSFPSAHSAVAFGAAWLISRRLPRLSPLLYASAALVGFSRVYLGHHYPTDVLVGAAAGIGLAAGFRRLLGWAHPPLPASPPRGGWEE